MKNLSITVKLTLLYAFAILLIILCSFFFLFSMSNFEIIETTKDALFQRVNNAQLDISYRFQKLSFDSDILDIENNIYISVYDEKQQLLYGRLPYDFPNDIAFSYDQIQEIKGSNETFFVYDLHYPLDGYGTLTLRGITSYSDAKRHNQYTLQIAIIVFPLLAIVSILIGYFISKKAFSPVAQIISTVQNIQSSHDFSKRIRLTDSKDEIHILANTFDSLLNTIETSLQREKQFNHDVAHELRTPLSILLMQCDTLQASQTSKEDIQLIEQMKTKIHALSSMINQLLFFARCEQGQQTIQKENIDFSECSEMIMLEYEEIAKQNNMTLQYELQDHISFYGDQTLLFRLWSNLLENAIRYGNPNGTIEIKLYTQDKQIHMIIKDDGFGIAQKDLPYIFQRFYRSEEARSQGSGSGLGLSMVKLIVELHNGTIAVDSTKNKGTTFHICFPMIVSQ